MKKIRVIIPAAEKELDIECNERAFVRDIIQDIRSILEKEGVIMKEGEKKFVFCKFKDGCVLEKNRSFDSYEIVDGESFFYL